MTAILPNNMLWGGDIVRQRDPLKHRMATASKCKDSVSDLLFNVMALSCYIRPHLWEYAQTTQDKVDYHTYPSGTTVIKAFIANDFIFYDDSD
jgi:hypothetical protein